MKKLWIILLFVVFLTGCGSTTINEGCSDGFHLEDNICIEDLHIKGTFTSGSDIVDIFTEFSEKQQLFSYRMNFAMTDDVALESSTKDAGSDDFSGTNNQVEGVDEMDNVLTDGKYIYIRNYNKIQIVLAYTNADEYDVLSIVKEIDIDSYGEENQHFYYQGMYVDEDRLLVVGSKHTHTCNEYYEDKDTEDTDYVSECKYYEYSTSTIIYEYNKDDFTIENEYELSGYYTGSRKIGDHVYFVTSEYIPFYYIRYEDREFSMDDYLPEYKVNGTRSFKPYEDVYYMEGTEPQNFTNFFGINLDTKEISSEIILGSGGYNLYVSTQNMYLTGTKWDYNDDVLAILEKADDPSDVELDESPYTISTAIIKVSIKEGIVTYQNSTSVAGSALDQFGMNERDGNLYIVTSTSNWWWWGWWLNTTPEINNRLIVLDENLEELSMLEHIGKEGESVQATRFVGNFVYIVTFLRTDPFYVIDVSDPKNPIKLSELEIPGFSDYLQPIGEDYILGIGYGDNDGGTNGLKISLYDVSDKENAMVASEIIYPYDNHSYMWTSTVYNHKDLLVSLDKGIIALPYTLNEYAGSNYNWKYYTGILVLNIDIDNGTISERARVEHSSTNRYDTYVYKSKYISDYIYTISSKYVKVSTIDDPETILNSLLIGEPQELYIPTDVEPTD